MCRNLCYIKFLAFEQEVALALKLNCRQGVFIFRNIEGNMFDINLFLFCFYFNVIKC